MRLRSFNKLILLLSLCWLVIARADIADELTNNDITVDKTKVVAQQIELLKNRYSQAKIELNNLQKKQDKQIASLSTDHVNKQWLEWAKIDIEGAKANLDGINIELIESQQTIDLIQREIEELTSQINAFSVFGGKISNNGRPNLTSLNDRLDYQNTLLQFEKKRLVYLQKLQKLAESTLQLCNLKYVRIEALLKSHTMMELKERQAKSEIDYQKQQAQWIEKLNGLYVQLAKQDHSHVQDKPGYKLENQIFYANENVNFMYLQMLIARYQDQIQQLKVSISRSTSIALLNKVTEQVQALSKQLARVNELLSARISSLEKRKQFLTQNKVEDAHYVESLNGLENQYKSTIASVNDLNASLNDFKVNLEQSMKQELSSRQGFLGFGIKTWLELCNQLLLVPALTFQVVKSLAQSITQSLSEATVGWWGLLAFLEIAWYGSFYLTSRILSKLLRAIPDHALGHISLKWLSISLIRRSLLDIAIVGNIVWFFLLHKIPLQSFNFIVYLGIVWLIFRGVVTVARLCLVETVHDRAGHDVRLYHRLKWTFIAGGIITAITVFLYQLPLLEVQDFFYRLFLLFLVIVSIFLLKAREVFTSLMLVHVDERRTYFRRIVQLLAVLFPLVLLINSAIGFFGFINFVLSVYWYEGIFLMVLAGYLLVRGLFNDVMEYFSHLLIRHVTNGWLWTEAFLKPIDKILRILLFLGAWVVLFFLYGWDRQSTVVVNLNKLLHYHLFDLLKTQITPLSIIELVIIVSLLYWAARWTREFVYRFLLSRTKDLGVRNSIAILSQYAMIAIGILIGLRVLGIELGALAVVAGAFALGIGFGLRDLANNFACGFLLLLERPLRVGDTVSISGQEGDVMHIGGRAVTIRTWDHMELVVPNTEIFNKTFINWTAKDYIVRSVVQIKINRQDDPHDVQALIYKTLATHKEVLSDPAPEVYLKELADDLIEFEVRYYVNLRQVRSRISVRSDVLLTLWDVFKQHGIHPPYPHHEIRIQGQLPSP